MQATRTLISQPAFAVAARGARWTTWLLRAWENFTLDADERYLRGAHDLADMEWRLRRLERGRVERFGPLDPTYFGGA